MTTNLPAPDWKLICSVDDIPVLGARRVARPQGLDVAVVVTLAVVACTLSYREFRR